MRMVIKKRPGIMNENRLPNLMKWFIIYLLVTEFLFCFGPLHFNIRNPSLVFFYLCMYKIAVCLGYYVGEEHCTRSTFKVNEHNDFTWYDEKRIRLFLGLGLFFAVLSIIRIAQTNDIGKISEMIIDGINSPADNYSSFIQKNSSEKFASSIASFLLTVGLPSCIVGIVLSVFYYQQLSTSSKILSILLVATFVASKLIVGANEGLFDIAIYIGVALFLRYQSQKVKNEVKHKSKKKIIYLFIACMGAIVLYYFTQNIIGRTKANFAFGTLGENYYNANAGINKYIPEGIFVTFVYLCVYLCEGYYGFALSTTLEWIPNFGVGFSSFVRNNLSDLFNVDLFKYSYQFRIAEQYNWGSLRNYHTAYTFWANDFSHIGVVIPMFIIGYVFCRCYYGSVKNNSKISVVMMPLLVTILFYLPANNKIFAQPASFLLFFYVCIYFFLRYVLRKK